MKKEIKVSQSLIKGLVDVKNDQACPKQFYHKYISKDYPRSTSDAMQLGIYFEYIATGALNPYDEGIPEPVLTKAGKLSTPYQRAENNAARLQQHLKDLEWEILDTSVELERDGCRGTADAIAKDKEGREFFIDLKYSGLLHDKWNELGWHPDVMEYRWRHRLQAIHYVWLDGGKKDFYFVIVSSTNEHDILIYKMCITEEALLAHEELLQQVKEDLNTISFAAAPSYDRCRSCGIKDICPQATNLPKIIELDV